jgi:large subunit ribosomal protein L30
MGTTAVFTHLGDGMAKLVIKQIRSTIGRKENQGRILKALGITRIGLEVKHGDTPQIRGMIAKVSHLLSVSEVEE